ncbi:MAG: LacI family transcriptional regulator [Devosia sp.]|uniref:LacI family DNA-binding transcriptional regulator n=1 Tax=Devosia sp. TaxID=1871048 RepID=UPI00261CF06E|nr:LacI family DNA-binding transcriptional regulator [Devosia sp.]MDB5587134.1 LacI family transcriptional regulator [Devosia sp.]
MTDQTITRPRPATIIDVAREAGVAVGTVSRYINGLPIRVGNRERIAQVIEELGYRRNSAAASMKTNTTHIVGMMVPAVGEFHAALLDQLTRRMRQTGRAVVCYCHDTDPTSFMDGLEFFASHRVDAVVIDGYAELGHRLVPYIDEGMLVVLYDNDMPGLLADGVFVANRQASKRLVDHVLELGHERVATIHGNLRDSVGRDRLEGYRDALKAHGVAEIPELLVDGNWNEQGGYTGMGDLMALPNPPTAVFGANYNMSIGALRWLREHDMSIPEDISLVSFDDVPAFSVHRPGITAVGQPVEKIAESIVSILAERLKEQGPLGKRRVRIDADITLRGSTRRLRR